MLTFYTNPNSRGRMVRWMLEEVGCSYETIVLEYESSSQFDRWGGAALQRPEGSQASEGSEGSEGSDDKTRFFRDVNPIGKVPAIVHDGQVVTESAAICVYLAEAFPAAGLAPTADERAAYYRWLFFAAGPVEQAVTNLRAGFEPLPEQEFFLGYGSYQRTVDQLDMAVQAHPYIAGDRFSAADVYVGSHIGWGLALKTLPPRDAFVSYASRLASRPAYQRAVGKDNALLALTGR